MKDEYTYREYANSLFEEMDSALTNEYTIIKTIKLLKDQEEWECLVAAFGIRKSKWFFTDFTGTLPQWIDDELASNERAIIHKHLVKIGARPAENKKPDTFIQGIVRRIFKIQ